MNIPLLDIKRQFKEIQGDMKDNVYEVLTSSDYILGTKIFEFENDFKKYLDIKYAIAVGNGIDSLMIALKALGISKGDEVITTLDTFFTTTESILALGAKPVYVDIDINTYNIDIDKIEAKITDKTKAIVIVHLFGQSADMISISKIAKKNGLKVVEDGCQALGSEYMGKKVGTMSDIACFSYYPTRNRISIKDGGIIATDDYDLAKICRGFRDYENDRNSKKAYEVIFGRDNENIMWDKKNSLSSSSRYFNYIIDFNSRLDELQAAILKIKLPYLGEWSQKRKETAIFYNEFLKDIKELKTPFINERGKHIFYMYVILSENKDKLVYFLSKKGINTGIHYQKYLEKKYKDLKYNLSDFPNTKFLNDNMVSIPVFAELSYKEKMYILESIKEYHL
jgi:dTDP-4-amino-4,6-dideoxygalactose transaminase